MKKFSIFALLILTFLISACSNTVDSEANKENKGSDEKYVIKLGHSDKEGDESITDWTARKFVELAEEYTDGKVEFEVYPASQLGDPLEQMQSVQSGIQEMTQGSLNNLSELAPSLNYMVLPYMFTSTEDARKAIDNLWDYNNELLVEQANMRSLLFTDAGPRVMTSDKDHPVRSLEDMKGFKMRIPPSAVSEAAFTSFGAQNITLPFTEVFTGLQQGIANGQENAVTTARTEHYYEVQKYITDINWQYTISAFLISEPYFQSLPKAIQEGLVKAGKEATILERERFDEMNEEDVTYLKEQGVEFLGQPEDFEQWVEKGRSTWKNHYKLIGNGDEAKGEEIVNKAVEIISQ